MGKRLQGTHTQVLCGQTSQVWDLHIKLRKVDDAHLRSLYFLLKHPLLGPIKVLKLEDPCVICWQVLLRIPDTCSEALQTPILLKSNPGSYVLQQMSYREDEFNQLQQQQQQKQTGWPYFIENFLEPNLRSINFIREH